jgi:hypothetical protein
MPRRTNPEIVLGLLLASLFWISALAWQSSYFPQSKWPDGCREAVKGAGISADDCKGFWERTASDPTASFTLGILIFNVVLGLSTVALWRVTRRSAEIAERAFSDLERPYVYIFGANGFKRESERMDPYDFFKYSVANYGKTPASLEDVCLKVSLGKTPEVPVSVGQWHSLRALPILTPNERREETEVVPDSIPTSQYADENTSPDDSFTVPDLEDGTEFFFWVQIKYHGPFSAGHETSACWKWDRDSSRLILYADEKYNYSR